MRHLVQNIRRAEKEFIAAKIYDYEKKTFIMMRGNLPRLQRRLMSSRTFPVTGGPIWSTSRWRRLCGRFKNLPWSLTLFYAGSNTTYSTRSNLWVIEKESSTFSQKMWSWQRKRISWGEMCGKISAVSKRFFERRQTFLGKNKTYNP